jgi:sugar phosphate isomerase/epimerase
MKFCVTTFTTQRVIDAPDLFPKLAQWGYDGIELWAGDMPNAEGYMSWWREDATRIADVWPEAELTEQETNLLDLYKALAESNGLEIAALAPYFDFTSGSPRWEESIEVARRYLKYADYLGAKVFRASGGRVPSAELTEQQWNALLDAWRILADLPAAEDKAFCLECHANRPEDTLSSILREVEIVDSPSIRILFQPTSFSDEADTETILDSLYAYVAHMHASGRMLEEGATDIDWEWVFPELQRRGYDGWVSIEGSSEPVLENLERLIAWLRDLIS